MSTAMPLDDREQWRADALDRVEAFALSGLTFTAEDLRNSLRPAPSGSCYGSIFHVARKAGLIICTGYRESTTPSRKRGVIRVWTATPALARRAS